MKKIINFAIIAHIDHGKSTLADRLLEITGTIAKDKLQAQFLDMNPIERERGVTIKMQPVTMHYKIPNNNNQTPNKSQNSNDVKLIIDKLKIEKLSNSELTLNLIDTPGHIDFSYEVERALASIEGALLLVDITQGIQAQTIYNFETAKQHNLPIIPVINKIDLWNDPERKETIRAELKQILGVTTEPVFISAKTGFNVDVLLQRIATEIPATLESTEGTLKALVFDSIFDDHKGILLFVRLFGGSITRNDDIYFVNTKRPCKIKEVGIFTPYLKPVDTLSGGEIGYIATGIKEPGLFLIGEIITHEKTITQANSASLPHFKKPIPALYVNIFPYKDADFEVFLMKIDRYRLNDASMVYERMFDRNLGRGIKGGFLGQFHLEIFLERMKREGHIELFITRPSVQFKINYKNRPAELINHASDIDYWDMITSIEEPFVKVFILTPAQYFNELYEYLTLAKAEFLDFENTNDTKMLVKIILPLRKIIEDFQDKVKSLTQGYASYFYDPVGYKISELSRIEVIVHNEIAPIFTTLMPEDEGETYLRYLLKKLKTKLPREQFQVKLQGAVNGKIIVREDLPALRKDLAAPLYGGDRSRKMKLWSKQKKTKKELGSMGKVKIPPDLFIDILKKQ